MLFSRDSTAHVKSGLVATSSLTEQVMPQHQQQTCPSFKETVGTMAQVHFSKQTTYLLII